MAFPFNVALVGVASVRVALFSGSVELTDFFSVGSVDLLQARQKNSAKNSGAVGGLGPVWRRQQKKEGDPLVRTALP
jgi:hypothetical protein